MRTIVYGVGAVGGVLAASIALDGREVVGIARGRMLERIREHGLTLVSYRGRETVDLPCVAGPDEIDWRPDDLVVLTMKSHDTGAALAALRAAGVYAQPIVCAQNGVANERMALRVFPNVLGVVVMLPAQYTEPGVVVANAQPKFGMLDCGRYPEGIDALTETVAAALDSELLLCAAIPRVIDGKYGKLLLNVGNAVAAALGQAARRGPWYHRARAEAEAAYAAAGIASAPVDLNDPRRDQMRSAPIEGIERAGSSTLQSLLRGTGSVETDYLNGEIALLGALHGVPTPVNRALVRVAQHMLNEGIAPGRVPDDIFAALVAECE